MIKKDYPFNLLRELPDIRDEIDGIYLPGVTQTIDELPHHYRQYIRLRYKNGMARTECAKELNMTMHNVEQLERNIHAVLRGKYKDGEITAVSKAERDELRKQVIALTKEIHELRKVTHEVASGKIKPDVIRIETPTATQPIPKELLIPIEFLDISTRAHGALKRGGCNTLYDITSKTREEFRKIRSVGDAVEKEIDALLKARGLSFLNDTGPSDKQGYPYNLIRAIYQDDKNDDTHIEQTNIQGLNEVLTTLTDTEKAMIHLFFEKGYTYKKTGEELQFSGQKTRNIIEKSLRKLRQNFRRKYYEKNYQKP